MAKAIQQRRTPLQEAPVTVVNVIPLWQRPKGLNFSLASNQLGLDFMVEATNVRLNRGYICSRPGLRTFGASTAGSLGTQLQVINFIRSTGESFVIRFDTDQIYLYNGTTWQVFTGAAAFTGSVTQYWTYTSWNDTLIISNGVDGTFTLDPALVTLTVIAQAPPAKQITTWAGRILASNTVEPGIVTGNRIRWTVRDNSEDWSGIGSGFEDLLSTPGGETDKLHGVFPVSEESAFIVRSNSIWQMSQTGDPDAPFRFSRTYNQIGTPAPNSIQSTPDGVVFFSLDNIYHVTLAGIQTIGGQIRTRLRDVKDISLPFGLYNAITREYHLGVSESGSINDPTMDVDWVYSFIDGGWTRYVFPFRFRSLGPTRFTASGSIEELIGSVDSLLGTISILGIQSNGEGMFVVGSTAGKYITMLDRTRFNDVTLDGADIDAIFIIASGIISIEDTRSRTKIIALELEYQSTITLVPTFSTSPDGGANWITFAQKPAFASAFPKLIRVVNTVTNNTNQVRITSLALGDITILGLYVHVVKDSRINP